ncbi:MAG: SURF1 family protein, partial [Chloroflexi bacterium]
MINNANLNLKSNQTTGKPRFSPAVLVSKKWLLPTLLVLLAMGVMVRLGYWQLNRLEQRRARNAFITRQLALPPLELTGSADLPADLADLNIRQATAQGQFDYNRQIALKLQSWQGRPGIHLVTPLVLPGGAEAVLVDRGFIPQDEAAPE